MGRLRLVGAPSGRHSRHRHHRRAAVALILLIANPHRRRPPKPDLEPPAAAGGARVIPQRGRGLTAAVLQAAAVAAAPLAVVIDGDGQHDPARIVDLLEPLLAGDADLVCGIRSPDTLRAGFGNGMTARWRHLGSTLFSRLAAAAVATAVPDPLTGMFACPTDRLVALIDDPKACPPAGYKPLPALLAATPPDRTTHVTVGFLPRSGGTSHMTTRTALRLCRQLAHLWLRRH